MSSESDLQSNLQTHSELFQSMLQLIPTGYYIMKDEDFVQSTKYFQSKKRKTPKEVHKENRMNAKRKKLDPQVNDDEVENDNIDEKLSDCEDNMVYGDASQAIDVSKIKSIPLEELKSRLRKKLEAFRAVRIVDKESSLKKHTNGTIKDATGNKKKSRVSQSIKEEKSSKKKKDVAAKPENEEEVEFNRLDFPSDKKKEIKKKKHGKKELEFMLEKAKLHQQKLQEISEKDSKKGEEVMENDKWKKAFTKTAGIKKKDDPILLQRTIKQIEKQKKRSSNEWQKRKDTTEQFKKKKQDKREKNIKERIEKKKKRNIGKKTKGTKKKRVRR